LRIISGGKLSPAVVALAIAASMGAAIASYYFIEQPFRRSALAAAPLLILYAMASLVALSICAVIHRSNGLPMRYPQLAQQENLIPGLQSDAPCLTDHENPNLSSQCYDASANGPSVALWGDSHSAALAPALRAIANNAGYSFVQLGKPACWPLSGAAQYDPLKRHFAAECLRFSQKVLSMISADRRIRIVFVAGYADRRRIFSPDETRRIFMDSLAASIRSLQASGKQVIVMDDAPSFDFDPLLRFTTSQIPVRHAIAMQLGMLNSNDSGLAPQRSPASAAKVTTLLQQTIARFSGVTLIDLQHQLCNETGRCVYLMDDRLLYRDSHHLTPDGARYALRSFRLPPATAMNN
jgi:hypothetical protein